MSDITLEMSSGAPIRAFLSHSSADHELVDTVVQDLGRPFVKVDRFAFDHGDELFAAIEEAISASSIFVLFASRASLDSGWVGEELAQARFEQVMRRVDVILTVIIDDSIDLSDLP